VDKVFVSGVSVVQSKPDLLKAWGGKFLNDKAFCYLALKFDENRINEIGFNVSSWIADWIYYDGERVKALKPVTVLQVLEELQKIGKASVSYDFQLSLCFGDNAQQLSLAPVGADVGDRLVDVQGN